MDTSLVTVDVISHPIFTAYHVHVDILRLDKIHPEISGNKFFKLVENVKEAKYQGFKSILTFGGAYSNHIHATASYAAMQGITSIGIIRGDELHSDSNDTLRASLDLGMQLYFVSRNDYLLKEKLPLVQELAFMHQSFIIPEGGHNALGVKGAEGIMTLVDYEQYDAIFCSAGTGTTIAGIINGSQQKLPIYGFVPMKKGSYIIEDIRAFADTSRLTLIDQYHFGGFGKSTNELIQFIQDFYKLTNIPLDVVYTGKMMYGMMDMIQQNPTNWKDKKVLIIHTGGLQGNKGKIFFN